METSKIDTNMNQFNRSSKRAQAACMVRQCNLCGEKFLAISKFERFCLSCKEGSELYHYYETLPNLRDGSRED